MDQIQHTYVKVNGLNIHLAETGSSSSDKVVIFLHGFPEIWYSWRHQLIAAGKAGYRAIALDFRGYGLSDAPPEPEKATFKDTISDLLAILDALIIPKVFLVAKDWGSRTAYDFTLLYPERVSGIITFGAPFVPPGPAQWVMKLPEGVYVSRWQESGRAEAEFARFDAKTIVRNVYILFSRSEIPMATAVDQEIMDLVEPSTPLPAWFSEQDLQVYGDLYEKSGFRTALKVPYRSLGEVYDLPDRKIETPTLLIVGEKDFSLKFLGMEEIIRSGKAKTFVPNLEISYISEGSHFTQEQFPDKVNELVLDFLSKHD
ncbi:bifunctional epoxide hydrolase 2-like [Impatiens glandulifera]|uniref:bifunctional epoxide hydrolase 2-like n=1 Tax=Impatiens glandulifera TaxID=253017 RepID=UPI001FB0D2C4|nr:bifunctional epoxide hydrolase 2-like [Impatiens glandulifera]